MSKHEISYVPLDEGRKYFIIPSKLVPCIHEKVKGHYYALCVFMYIAGEYNSQSKAKCKDVPFRISVRKLAKLFGATPKTINLAVKILTDSKLIVRERNKGGRATNEYRTNNKLLNALMSNCL